MKNKLTTFLVLTSLFSLSSCGGDKHGVPCSLYHLDVTYDLNSHYEKLENDKENNRFIYTLEYPEEKYIGEKYKLYTHVYIIDNPIYENYDFNLKVFDTYSNSYLEKKDEYTYELVTVKKRELYLYYDDIYKEVNERLFKKYEYQIYLLNYTIYTSNNNKYFCDVKK